jgi:hypothetical protein
MLLATQPDVFFLMEHYGRYPIILVHLECASRAQLADIVERAWRRVAPATALRKRDLHASAVRQGRRP